MISYLMQVIVLFVFASTLFKYKDSSIPISVLLLLPFFIVLLGMYDLVPASVAQDRLEYFTWYQNTNLSSLSLNNDPLFSILLGVMPVGLTISEFSYLFISSILAFLLIAATLSRVHRLGIRFFVLFFLMVLTDRLALGALFTTSRSFLAVLFLFPIFFTRKASSKLVLAALGLMTHWPVVTATLLIYVCSLKRIPLNVLRLAFASCLAYFLLNFVFHFSLVTNLVDQSPELLLIFGDSRFGRLTEIGFASNLSLTMFILICVSLVIPITIIVNQSRKSKSVFVPKDLRGNQYVGLNFIVLSVCCLLVFYQEIPLVLRLLVLPLLLIPFYLKDVVLHSLVAVKGVAFLYFISVAVNQ